MAEMMLSSDHKLFALNKEELVNYVHSLEKEVGAYKRKMLTKKGLIERYNHEITESCINKWMSRGIIAYVKPGGGEKGAVFFPLDKVIEAERSGLIRHKPTHEKN